MAKTTWINAEEAFDTGFCDEKIDSADLNKKRVTNSLLKNGVEGAFKEARLILNSLVEKEKPTTIIKNPNMENLTLIANYLDLADGTSEAKILNAIKKKDEDHEKALKDSKAEKKKAEDKAEHEETEAKKMKKELDEKKAEYDKMKAEYDEFKKKDSEDKAKAKKEKDDKIGRAHV